METSFGSLGNDKRYGMSFDACSDLLPTKANKLSQMNPYERKGLLDVSRGQRNGFSKSLGDLSMLDSQVGQQRRTVMFEEDLRAHAAMLERARSRFRELELKYPEVFRNSPRTSSVSSLNNWRGSGVLKQPSFELTIDQPRVENQSIEVEVKENDELGDLSDVQVYRKLSSGAQRRKAPLLSSSMRSHHLEDSCDSAFDELDRESIYSRTSHDRSPTTHTSRFLYPGDSLESDKDSGISTDQPFVPTASKPPVYPKRTTFLESDVGNIGVSKSMSLSQPSLVCDSSERENKRANRSVDRQGILKSTAYRNQEIRSESLDAEFPLENVKYRTKRNPLQALKTGSEVYRRSICHLPSCDSLDDVDSDAETVYSIKSEVIVRPRISARQQYLSTYGLNRKTDENFSNHNRLYKSTSLPNLGFSQSLYDDAPGFSGGVLMFDNPKKRKKRILQRFGQRSGLYVVNDIPKSEKPKLPFSSSSSRKKRKSKLRKAASLEPTHVNELTKSWFDHTTAVSRPSNGQSLGRIVTMREDIGMAYEIELQRPNNGLFGFFIQKGYKHFRKGIFISRIMDSSGAKFLAGLLNPGDEILEINTQCTKTKTISEVHNIMANSNKLSLTILPFIGRKDW